MGMNWELRVWSKQSLIFNTAYIILANNYFQFKQFIIHQDKCAMKVTTDSCLFGALVANAINNSELIITNCLDIGGGTGLLSLMLAQKSPQVKFDAVEVDKDAFEQAKENVAVSPWANNIKIHHADIKVLGTAKKYDAIISNPPFYENELKGNDQKKNIAHHNDGLLLPELLKIISGYLNDNGVFYILLPCKRYEEAKLMCSKNNLLITKIIFVKQSEKHNYFRVIVEGKRINENNLPGETISEIAIKNSSGEYTTSFVNLLKDYYLHL
jgi:tRNA1Val (adenine37-N6)-methyltransferase